MRLLYSTGSPFARIVRIALLETGLDARVTKQEVTREGLYSAESEVLAFNPVGRVPPLALDDGLVLTETKLILDYIDAVNRGPKLLPRDGSDGWRSLADIGQSQGYLRVSSRGCARCGRSTPKAHQLSSPEKARG